jgi:phosphoglycolate phosphatase-like HAD superfamily hydrolase
MPAPAQSLVAVDSDGCVFDSMNRKHREAFLPALIDIFELEARTAEAAEIWESINLFGPTRGINRFQALNLLLDRLDTKTDTGPLRQWLRQTASQSAAALEASADGDPLLKRALAWSREVDRRTANLPPPPPFPGAAEALQAAGGRARRAVVSQAPHAVLVAEWAHAGLDTQVETIAGQEYGNKTAQVRALLGEADATAGNRTILVGDAPGDRQTARNAGIGFFPILPGEEAASWKRLHEDGLPRLFEERFDAGYQSDLDAAFDNALTVTLSQ